MAISLRKLGASVLACFLSLAALIAAEAPWSAERMMDDLMWSRGSIGGAFTLTDHSGRTRTDTEFRGKLMLIYFGYTMCPDICPTDLMTISQAIEALGDASSQVQPIFITIDPERDNANLADYVSAFHPRLIGLTGDMKEIRNVALAFRAYFAKKDVGQGDDYTIDHTGVIYLVGRKGQYLGFVPPQTSPQRLTEVLREQLTN